MTLNQQQDNQNQDQLTINTRKRALKINEKEEQEEEGQNQISKKQIRTNIYQQKFKQQNPNNQQCEQQYSFEQEQNKCEFQTEKKKIKNKKSNDYKQNQQIPNDFQLLRAIVLDWISQICFEHKISKEIKEQVATIQRVFPERSAYIYDQNHLNIYFIQFLRCQKVFQDKKYNLEILLPGIQYAGAFYWSFPNLILFINEPVQFNI
ncbi:hypothetical protein PPERSA_12351 [Pseudocohnilembus persalinus]|uniref:Uncharacterized protein n=1 Tax=Pseudocohnilembus persalinus TaxID=266149 RepID=A0A0V0R0Z3_PSEPJ|nr:hypothetical protein PPERSA_12351 [Pseudocohnilembus persalinus]|eukprot:KRX08196.1 hypothetical protein PPERSA_12351 [Pseudocohnilembus persalinus]